MLAAVVESFERSPVYGTFREPAALDAGQIVVEVRASALTNLVRGQASGRHYSSATPPLVPGADGVGRTPDRRTVYFFGPVSPWGSMAERSLVAQDRTLELPEGMDAVTAAALGNPGMASWGALLGRARFQAGEAVLVNGATGAAGQQAVQAARAMGARRVVATGRDEAVLERLRDLGADETISLRGSEEEQAKAFTRVLREQRTEVVLDYLWGRSAEMLLQAAAGHGAPEGESRIRYVQIGSISGSAVTLEAGWLRSSGLELLGSGLGSLSAAEIRESVTAMFAHAAKQKLVIATEAVPLSEVEAAWRRSTEARVVFTMGG